MKYRIREEVCCGYSVFYTERWHEPYGQWVAALHCNFRTFQEAQRGIDFWHSQHYELENPNTILHAYIPR